MTGLSTARADHEGHTLSYLGTAFLVTTAFGLPFVCNWTDVRLSIAIGALFALHRTRIHLVTTAVSVAVTFLVFGPLLGASAIPWTTWLVVAVVASGETVVLWWLMRRSVASASSSLPSSRIAVFVAGAATLSLLGGSIEYWLVHLTGGRNEWISWSDIVVGVGIATCLGAIGATRRGTEWFLNARFPGAELLAPLMVILVTLVAMQVTRQLWAQRDVDQLEILARSARASLVDRWERENDILLLKSEGLAPVIAADPSAFDTNMSSFVRGNDLIAAAVLTERGGIGGTDVILGSITGTSIENIAAPVRTWLDSIQRSENPLVGGKDFPFVVRRVELGTSSQGTLRALLIAYSIPNLLRSVTTEVIDSFSNVVITLSEPGSDSRGERGSIVWQQGSNTSRRTQVTGGTVRLGDSSFDLALSPTTEFGTDTKVFVLVLGAEIMFGLILAAVLVFGANAQFKMTQERRRREVLLEAALDATPGQSVVFDKNFRILAANRPVRQEFGDLIPGLTVVTLFGAESDPGRRRLIDDLLRQALDGRSAHAEIADDQVVASTLDSSRAQIPISGQMRIIELSAYPVVSEGGEPVGFLHSVDATERRSLAMRSAQSERMESLGSLAGGLAHDFNNLLFVTLGNLQLMAMNETVTNDEKLSKFVSRSMSAVERGAEITKSLLAVARSQPLEESAVSLADLVKGLLPLVRQALGSGRRVDVDIADPSLQLMVDAGRLSSCILNLSFNSRDAMGPNGTLRISGRLAEDGDMIELAIADDGAGMPADVVSRAFEPFFTTKSPGSGTGLGLATVYAFAKQSGGTAFLESREGVGTTVTLVLPRYTGEVRTPEVTSTRRAGRRVVVADDEQSLAEMVAAWLIDMGIDARFATSPKSALELIELFVPDVLVSDANFGEELDGIELARLGTAIVPDMAVVFMTGYSTSMRELQELGERTLAKPFSREDLYAALSPLIAERREDELDSVPFPASGDSK